MTVIPATREAVERVDINSAWIPAFAGTTLLNLTT